MPNERETVAASYIEPIKPADLAIKDHSPRYRHVLEITRRDDSTVSVMIVGPGGGIKGWVEIDSVGAAEIVKYLSEGVEE